MDLFFINLADQADRRAFVESNFNENNDKGWRLHRIEAVAARAIEGTGVLGPIRDAEKGCFLSHIDAVAASRQCDGHAFIAEDDILFGKKSFQTIESILGDAPEDSWDIIFTDMVILDAHTMMDCFLQRRRVMAAGGPVLINLRDARFAGSTAYIVNARAKDKVANLIRQDGTLDLPYDLYLKRLIRNDMLRAFVVFPFATTVSSFGDRSQIQTDDSKATEFIWNSFRQLMWLERDADQAMEAANRIAADVTDFETIAFSKMLAGMFAPGFKGKRI